MAFVVSGTSLIPLATDPVSHEAEANDAQSAEGEIGEGKCARGHEGLGDFFESRNEKNTRHYQEAGPHR